MLYRLLSNSGSVKNCYLNDAQSYIDSGCWIDITKYKDEDKKNGFNVLLQKRLQSKKSEHQSSERKSDRLQCSGDSKANGSSNISKANEIQRQEDVEPKKRKRGRPPKIKVPSNASN